MAVVVGVAKFALGAWMVLILIPMLIAVMWVIHRHYRAVEAAVSRSTWTDPRLPQAPPRVIVPVSRLDRPTIEALAYARSISNDVTAVHVADEDGRSRRCSELWSEWGGPVQLVILESPYRALLAPLLAYIDATESEDAAPADHRRPGRVRAAPLVGVPAAQPDGAAAQAAALLPAEHGGRRRARSTCASPRSRHRAKAA